METKSKILLVEDDFVIALANKTILQDIGCHVDVASTGSQAIELSENNIYDLILMDLGLGDTTGYAVTKQIKLDSLNSATPVVALTAHPAAEVEEDCLKVGMLAVETKPLYVDSAKQIIAKFARGKD